MLSNKWAGKEMCACQEALPIVGLQKVGIVYNTTLCASRKSIATPNESELPELNTSANQLPLPFANKLIPGLESEQRPCLNTDPSQTHNLGCPPPPLQLVAAMAY